MGAQPTLQGFFEFASTKPRDSTFRRSSFECCAHAQYCASIGREYILPRIAFVEDIPDKALWRDAYDEIQRIEYCAWEGGGTWGGVADLAKEKLMHFENEHYDEFGNRCTGR